MVATQLTRRTVLAAAAAGVGIGTLDGVAASAAAATPPWSGYRGGPRHGGATTASGPGTTETKRWSIGSEDQPSTAAAVKDGVGYVGVGERLLAFDAASGSGRWSTQVGSSSIISPAVGEENVYVTTEDGDVRGYSREDGSEQWDLGLGGEPGAPAVAGGTVYAGNADGRIVAIDTASGDPEWTASVDVDINFGPVARPTPAVTDGTVFVNASYDLAAPSKLVAIDAESGEVDWTHDVDADHLFPPAISGDKVCVTARDPYVGVVSAAGGIEQWSTTLSDNAVERPAAVGDGVLAVVDDPGIQGSARCSLFDLATGEEQWTYEYDDATSPYSVAVSSERVYFTAATGSRSGVLVALGRDNGFETFTRETGHPGSPAAPAPLDSMVLSFDGAELAAYGPKASSSATATPTSTGGADGETATPANREAETSSSSGGDAGDADDSDTQRPGGSGSATTSAPTNAPAGDSDRPARGFFVNGGDGPFGGDISITLVSILVTVASMLLSLVQMARGGSK